VGLNAIQIAPFNASCDDVNTPGIGISYGGGYMEIFGRPLPKDQLHFPYSIRN
jgi:hypothetical protein